MTGRGGAGQPVRHLHCVQSASFTGMKTCVSLHFFCFILSSLARLANLDQNATQVYPMAVVSINLPYFLFISHLFHHHSSWSRSPTLLLLHFIVSALSMRGCGSKQFSPHVVPNDSLNITYSLLHFLAKHSIATDFWFLSLSRMTDMNISDTVPSDAEIHSPIDASAVQAGIQGLCLQPMTVTIKTEEG